MTYWLQFIQVMLSPETFVPYMSRYAILGFA